MASRLEKTSITPKINSMAGLVMRDQSFFEASFHCHPELELVYIIESNGRRIIGNVVEEFNPGDMVIIGPNTPHTWINDDSYYTPNSTLRARAQVLYFNSTLFNDFFYQQEENLPLSVFLKNSIKGLKITGPTKVIIAEKLQHIQTKTGIDKLIGIIEILSILSKSSDLSPINEDIISKPFRNHINDRIPDIINYVNQHYMHDLSLETLSKHTHMTRQSFCRFFKSKMKINFLDFVNEVRINNACRLLMETDLAIFEIAYDCGYQTVSNFNKVFKELKGITPVQFRINTQIKI